MKRITTPEQARSYAKTGKQLIAKVQSEDWSQHYLNKFLSPRHYESWNDHISMCLIQAGGLLKNPGLLNHLSNKPTSEGEVTERVAKEASTGLAVIISYMALMQDAPARYLDSTLAQSFLNTKLPSLDEPPPIALPAFRLFLPNGLLRSDVDFPVNVIVVMDRLEIVKMLEEAGHKNLWSRQKPGFVMVAFLQTGESYFLDYLWSDPSAGLIPQQEKIKTLMTNASKLVAHTILTMAYEPELIVVDEPATVTAGRGFSAADNSEQPAPATWVGKGFRTHILQPVIKKGQAIPTGRHVRPHWRTGHWRACAIGPGRKDHRLTWIKPVYVGAIRD